ncbi:hypothetical protein X777_02619 [Ooceraea biroi]|uniref:Uncharacterized protein n=1 Tax=Ooceraea biroi TaxID=2015173 RepID=A0A026WN37_OOCBI|nr:hypothetical protein X777_02619 [Ooceraea biroi]
MSISTPAWTSTSFFPPPPDSGIPYRYVPVLYLRRSHIWIGAHHIPPPPVPSIYLPHCIDTSPSHVYGRNIVHMYLYYISRNIEWTSYLLVVSERRRRAMGCSIACLECALDYRHTATFIPKF